jgi:tuberous sclerosis 2
LVHDIFSGSKDSEKPDPISGLSWSTQLPQPNNYVLNPSILAPLLTSYPNDPSRRLQKFPDYNKLVGTLESIDWCPVIDTHKVAVLYVAPGQSEQDEILANRHGSPAYTRFIKQLGRVVKVSDELEVYTGGLRADRHGDYALAWWDDICQTLFYVATLMPNINMRGHPETYWKQAEIGNIAVKIIWNDSGKPFERTTFAGDFNHFNIIIEPHTLMPEAAYQRNVHGFFKVLLQSDPSLPRITPTGEFKLVLIDDLPRTVSHFAFIACLFCKAWTETGSDGDFKMVINTSWRQRLNLITRSERFLNEGTDYSFHGLPGETTV